MRTGVIYGLVCRCPHCDPEEVRYVGQTLNLTSRKAAHKTPSAGYATPRYKFVHFHGANNIDLVPLEENVPADDLNDREAYWIQRENTFVLDSERGLNATQGGDQSEWDARYYDELRKTRQDLNWAARKMTWEKVRSLREDYRTTDTPLKDLAEKYGVAEGTMHKILKNESWKDGGYEFVRRSKGDFDYNYGEKAYAAKLTWEQVAELRKMYCSGVSPTHLAQMFGITQSAVTVVGLGRTWKDRDYQPPTPESLKEPRKKWLLEQRYPAVLAGTLREEYNKGRSHYQLRKKYGVPANVLSSILDNELHPDPDYVKRRPKNAPLSDELRQEMDAEIIRGVRRSSEIADLFGISKQTVVVRKREIL